MELFGIHSDPVYPWQSPGRVLEHAALVTAQPTRDDIQKTVEFHFAVAVPAAYYRYP